MVHKTYSDNFLKFDCESKTVSDNYLKKFEKYFSKENDIIVHSFDLDKVTKITKNGIIMILTIVSLFGKFIGINNISHQIIFICSRNANRNDITGNQFFLRPDKYISVYLRRIHISSSNIDIVFI